MLLLFEEVLQLYVLAPNAVNVKFEPAHSDELPLMDMDGKGLAVMLSVLIGPLPQLLIAKTDSKPPVVPVFICIVLVVLEPDQPPGNAHE